MSLLFLFFFEKELEKKLDIFNLTYIRCCAELEARKIKEQEPQTWWESISQWWNGNKFFEESGFYLKRLISLCIIKI